MYIPSFRITTLGLLGVVIFLFIGCSTLSNNTEPTTTSYPIDDRELTEKLAQIDSDIEQNPDRADLYHQKTTLLAEAAQSLNSPLDRETIYIDLYTSSQKALEYYQNNQNAPDEKELLEFLKRTWDFEQNAGLEIINSDSDPKEIQWEKAIAHFKNATIIIPDTSVSYQNKAETEYENGLTEKAIATLEKGLEHIDNPPDKLAEQLAFLYQETGKHSKAIDLYEEIDTVSKDTNILHGLTNSYIALKKHQKAIEILDLLVEYEPENVMYKKIRGGQLYFLGEQKIDSLRSSALDEEDRTKLFSDTDSLWKQADTNFQQVLRDNQNNQEWNKELAEFYQNMSAEYQQSIKYLNSDQKNQAEKAIANYLGASIPLYIKLTEKNPENKQYWDRLHQAYLYLNMDEKAEEAKEFLNQS